MVENGFQIIFCYVEKVDINDDHNLSQCSNVCCVHEVENSQNLILTTKIARREDINYVSNICMVPIIGMI